MSKTNGPALLFEHVEGSSFPLLINAFGSYKRMENALNCDSFDDIAKRITGYLHVKPPESITDKIKMLFTLKEVADYLPKKVKKAP